MIHFKAIFTDNIKFLIHLIASILVEALGKASEM